MIEIGKEYIFNYRVDDDGAAVDEVELCINNSGLNCRVIEDLGERILFGKSFGHLYEVESCTGSQFFAYESELDELKDGDIRCF